MSVDVLAPSSQPIRKEKISVIFSNEKQDKPKPQLKKINRVSTTKYSVLSWAPLSLFMQFTRAANIYFLVICVLTTLSFSPKNPISMIGTFAAILLFTMLKEAYEVNFY